MRWLFNNLFKPEAKARKTSAVEDILDQANIALGKRNLPEAARLYQRAIELEPGQADSLYRLANVLKDQALPVEALARYDQAITLRPGFWQAHCNRGAVLHSLGRLDEALASLALAQQIEPKDEFSYYNAALVLQGLRRWDEALRSYQRAIDLNPQFSDAQYNRALLLLSCGDFTNGWRVFEWRWKVAERLRIGTPRGFSTPLWLGEQPIAGKRLLLHSEGGLGDVIQFSRYASLCSAHGAYVTLEAPNNLVPLLHSVPGVHAVIPKGSEPPAFDLHCPLMSLPLAFNTTATSVPHASGYLSVDDAHVRHWQARLANDSRPRVGLVWSGNPDNWIDQHRSIALAEWAPLLPSTISYYSLQTQVRSSDAASLKAAPITTYDAKDLDFIQTAALCMNLDLVVCVDTSIAHLAGALSRPTWLLLPNVPDWRWGLAGHRTPWYSSVRIFRQGSDGDWQTVLHEISLELANFFK